MKTFSKNKHELMMGIISLIFLFMVTGCQSMKTVGKVAGCCVTFPADVIVFDCTLFAYNPKFTESIYPYWYSGTIMEEGWAQDSGSQSSSSSSSSGWSTFLSGVASGLGSTSHVPSSPEPTYVPSDNSFSSPLDKVIHEKQVVIESVSVEPSAISKNRSEPLHLRIKFYGQAERSGYVYMTQTAGSEVASVSVGTLACEAFAEGQEYVEQDFRVVCFDTGSFTLKVNVPNRNGGDSTRNVTVRVY